MDFQDILKSISENILKRKNLIETREAAKQAFVLPFIQALGYNIFDPTEVIPEFTVEKGKKVDYAITQNNDSSTPVILIECRSYGEDLNIINSQLSECFHASNAKVGILTNGVNYRFYTDMKQQNEVDDFPFFEFDITSLNDSEIEMLKRFHERIFDSEKFLEDAIKNKFSDEIISKLKDELENPSDEFIKLLVSKIYKDNMTDRFMKNFIALGKDVVAQYPRNL